MADPIVHFEIAAKDKSAIVDFYSSLFGWDVNSDNPIDYGMTEAKDGDVGITGGFYQADESSAGLRLYAQVDDAEEYLKKVVELGGTVVTPVQEVPGQGIKVAMFLDPEGNQFGVTQPTGEMPQP